MAQASPKAASTQPPSEGGAFPPSAGGVPGHRRRSCSHVPPPSHVHSYPALHGSTGWHGFSSPRRLPQGSPVDAPSVGPLGGLRGRGPAAGRGERMASKAGRRGSARCMSAGRSRSRSRSSQCFAGELPQDGSFAGSSLLGDARRPVPGPRKAHPSTAAGPGSRLRQERLTRTGGVGGRHRPRSRWVACLRGPWISLPAHRAGGPTGRPSGQRRRALDEPLRADRDAGRLAVAELRKKRERVRPPENSMACDAGREVFVMQRLARARNRR